MSTQTRELLSAVAQEFHLSEDDLLRESVRTLLERQLGRIKAEIFEIRGRYGISSVEDMESRYREDTLEEADSWRDLQRLDRLEYKRDRLVQLLEDLTPQTLGVCRDLSAALPQW